jgi:hypothetical protein
MFFQLASKTLRHFAILSVAVLVLGLAPSARAQVYEWVDEAGDRNYVNSLDQVPQEKRSSAKVVVGGATKGADETAPSTTTNQGAPDRNNGETQRNDADNERYASGWDAGFAAGFDAGTRAAVQEQPVCAAEPAVVVLESRPPSVLLNVPPFDPTGAYYRPNGSVSVGFDDGASRGLTHRERDQKLRTISRGW